MLLRKRFHLRGSFPFPLWRHQSGRPKTVPTSGLRIFVFLRTDLKLVRLPLKFDRTSGGPVRMWKKTWGGGYSENVQYREEQQENSQLSLIVLCNSVPRWSTLLHRVNVITDRTSITLIVSRTTVDLRHRLKCERSWRYQWTPNWTPCVPWPEVKGN